MLVSVLTTTGCGSCLHAHYVIGEDQDNRRIDSPPNHGREPPLVWSVEFTKKDHIASNDIAPLVFPLVDRDGGAAKDLKGDWSVKVRWAFLGATVTLIVVWLPHSN